MSFTLPQVPVSIDDLPYIIHLLYVQQHEWLHLYKYLLQHF